MRLRIALLLTIACLAITAGPVRSQTAAENLAVLRSLQEVIETKDFVTPMTLKEAFQLSYAKYQAKGKDLPILVNVGAFKNERDPKDDEIDLYDTQVSLSPVAPRMPMYEALRSYLSKVRPEATYIVRRGFIEIVPPKLASIRSLLKERVMAEYRDMPLRDVLDDLAAYTGAPILLDSRAKDKGKERVSLLLNNLALQDALEVLTEQAGLRYVIMQTGIFVTTAEDAPEIEKRQRRQSAESR